MKGAKVEVYFAMYLTAIISFFTVNELVEQWRHKAQEREIILIEVIKSLVEIGDVFEWSNVEINKGVLRGKVKINSSFDLRSSLRSQLLLFSTQNPKDSIIITKDLVMAPGQTDWEFSSSELKKGIEYKLQLVTANNIKVIINKNGEKIIKGKLMKFQSDKLGSAKINIDSVANFIANNIQSVTTSIRLNYLTPISVKDTLTAPLRTEKPFIENVLIVISGTNNNYTFTYGNINMNVMKSAKVQIGNQGTTLTNIGNNSVTYSLSNPLKEGTYNVSVSGIPDINCDNAKVKVVKLDIECENIFYDGDDLIAKINAHGETNLDLRWKVEKEGNPSRNSEGKGTAIKFSNAEIGKYSISVTDKNGNALTQKSVDVKTPPSPQIVEFRVDSVRRVSAIVNVYGQKNSLKRIVTGFAGTKEWQGKWDEVWSTDSRKEYKVYCELNPNDCDKAIIIKLVIEDKNGSQSNEKRERKTIKCN